MKINFQEKMLLVVLAGVVLLYVGINFLIMPAWNSMQTANAQFSQTEASRTEAQADLTDASGIETAKQTAKEKALKASDALLPAMNKSELQLYLVPIMQAHGLSLASIQIGDPMSDNITVPTTSSGATAKTPQYKLKQAAGATTASGTASVSVSTSTSSASSTSSATSSTSSTASTSSGTTNGMVMSYKVTLTCNGTSAQGTALLDAFKDTGKTILVTNYKYASPSASYVMTIYCAAKPS